MKPIYTNHPYFAVKLTPRWLRNHGNSYVLMLPWVSTQRTSKLCLTTVGIEPATSQLLLQLIFITTYLNAELLHCTTLYTKRKQKCYLATGRVHKTMCKLYEICYVIVWYLSNALPTHPRGQVVRVGEISERSVWVYMVLSISTCYAIMIIFFMYDVIHGVHETLPQKGLLARSVRFDFYISIKHDKEFNILDQYHWQTLGLSIIKHTRCNLTCWLLSLLS